jgi:hypothetical protein
MQFSGNLSAILRQILTFNLVIPVYNRLQSISRLMKSLLLAHIRGNMNLYISCDGNSSAQVKAFVESIDWRFGKFEVIHQARQLGVDKHNIACISMAKDLGNVVVLEDDLIVSPYFQAYLISCQSIIKGERKLAGVSLYRYPMVEQDHFPFELIPSDEFTYYQQRPSSKGCFYSSDMAKDYEDFLGHFIGDFGAFHLPDNVKKWGDEVWEKSFYCYLQQSDKYLAFPMYSYTTDFADMGVHMKKQTTKYVHQSPLMISEKVPVAKFWKDTINVYDAFYELRFDSLKQWRDELADMDIELDLHGRKDLNYVKSKFMISSKICTKAAKGWERRLKPELNNIIFDQVGSHYKLGLTVDFKSEVEENLKEKFLYYYPDTRLSELVKMKWREVISRFIKW